MYSFTLLAALVSAPPDQDAAAALALAAASQQVQPAVTQPAGKLTYSQAYDAAVAAKKPLVCWVGGGDVVCPACVQTMKDEAVHCIVDSLPGIPSKAIMVGMPDGNGLTRVAVITEWITGSEQWGHVASTRRAIRNWNATRWQTFGGWSLDPVPAITYQPPPGNVYPATTRRRGG